MSHFPISDAATIRPLRLWVGAASVVTLLAACTPAADTPSAASGGQDAPGTPVNVAHVLERNSAPEHTYLARLESAERVEIRPRVSGQVDAVLFREGELVAAGQPLFRLHSAPFDIAVQRAEADLKLHEAHELMARQAHERAEALKAEQAISAEELERRASAYAQAAAQVAYAQAALNAARLDREFSVVKAPIAGRVGRALVTRGHQVVAGPAQAPMTVLASSALHVHLDLPMHERAADTGTALALPIKARLHALGQTTALAHAVIDYRDPEVQSKTGAIRLRGRIEAGATTLIAGQHVMATLQQRRGQKSLWIPDAAVSTDQGHHYALVMRPDQVVEYRAVQLGVTQGRERQVLQGLRAGETVVAEGLMRVRPGAKVQPTVVDASGTAIGQADATRGAAERSGG